MSEYHFRENLESYITEKVREAMRGYVGKTVDKSKKEKIKNMVLKTLQNAGLIGAEVKVWIDAYNEIIINDAWDARVNRMKS